MCESVCLCMFVRLCGVVGCMSVCVFVCQCVCVSGLKDNGESLIDPFIDRRTERETINSCFSFIKREEGRVLPVSLLLSSTVQKT